MSKPVTQDEVEDVLSSIRRLVSEDKRPLAGMRSPAAPERAQPAARAASQDKLVLTPALRVANPDASDTAQEEDTAEPLILDEAVLAPSDGDADTQPDTLFSDELTVPDTTAPTERETAEDEEAQAYGAEDVLEDEGEGDYSSASYWEDDDPADDDQNQPEDTRAQPEGIEDAVLSALANEPAEAPFIDTDAEQTASEGDTAPSEDDAPDIAAFTQRLRSATIFRPKLSDDGGDRVDAAPRPAPEADSQETFFDTSLTSKIAALETAIGAIRQDFEPDGDEAEDIIHSENPALAWEDDVELDARGTPLREQPDEREPFQHAAREAQAAVDTARAADADEEDTLTLDDGLMDEETLRDLVSEIVRAELQGALGERITRNVRKLVRREIHRALTAQDLE
ncbi:hypothetical protein ABMC89_06810 [Sulfitobacter sp. HNIBRBA3233]|uniref:hypothetical protein n=1 Tax=Sulfitobacter marinivivus TaxID=3158558 RepID=UPI0032DE8DD7